MAIFNNTYFTNVNESYTAHEEDFPNIMPTEESGYQIAAEGCCDINTLISSLYVSDVLIESKIILEGATDGEVLVEGVIKTFAKKVKDKFLEILAKIKAWFKKVKDYLKVKFTATSKFAIKYEDKLKEKASIGYTHDMYMYNENMTIDKIVSKYTELVEKVEKHAGDTNNKDDNDIIEELDGVFGDGDTTISDIKKKIITGLQGKKDTYTLNTSTVDTLIKYCKEGYKSDLDKLTKAEDESVKAIKKVISDIDEKDENIKKKTKLYNHAISLITNINPVILNALKAKNREYVAALRALMLFKPVKNSYIPDDQVMAEASIFESALNLL